MKTFLNHADIYDLTKSLADCIAEWRGDNAIRVYPIPRGGIPVAYALLRFLPELQIVSHPQFADCFVDDLIDSGATSERYTSKYPAIPFFTMIDKKDKNNPYYGKWIVFPWENAEDGKNCSADDIVIRLLQLIGEDPDREGLQETPQRAIKAWRHWCDGYGKDPKDIMKVFKDGGERYDQMVTVKDIPFYSHCEHHLAPFFGTVTISYIPNGKIIGLSKLSRLADMFARRLQVQERMTDQIADALNDNLEPKGVGVLIKARHLCMESRGIQQQGHHTITTSLRGEMRNDSSTRAEFLQLAK